MGIFSNIGNMVQSAKDERQKRKAEEKQVEEARRQALHEARIKAAPDLAKRQVQIESNLRLKELKTGKSRFAGINMGELQNMASGIGQAAGSQFNADFNTMFGGGGSIKEKKGHGSSGGFSNSLTQEYDTMFGGKERKPKSKSSSKYKKVHRKGKSGKQIVIKL